MSVAAITGLGLLGNPGGHTHLQARSEAWWDVRSYVPGGSGVNPLIDRRGSHDLHVGGVKRAYMARKALVLPSVSGNYASILDTALLDITGDVDLRWFGLLDDWTPVTTQSLVGKYDVNGDNRSYLLDIHFDTGKIRMVWSETGTVGQSVISTVAVPTSDGDPQWIRGTLDVDDGSGNRVIKFYTGGSGVTPVWVQLGSTVTIVGTTNVFSGTASVEVGSFSGGTSSLLSGKAYRAQVYDGIDGTLILDVDFTKQSDYATSFLDETGNHTVTVNQGAASGADPTFSTMGRPHFQFATDDFLEADDHDALDFAETEDLTVVALLRVADSIADQAIVAKKLNLTTGAGYSLDRGTGNATRFMIADGILDDDDVAAALIQDVWSVVAGVRNVSDDDLEAFHQGVGSGSPTVDSTTASLATSAAFRVGRLSGASTAYLTGDIAAIALFREALSDLDIFHLTQEFGVAV